MLKRGREDLILLVHHDRHVMALRWSDHGLSQPNLRSLAIGLSFVLPQWRGRASGSARTLLGREVSRILHPPSFPMRESATAGPSAARLALVTPPPGRSSGRRTPPGLAGTRTFVPAPAPFHRAPLPCRSPSRPPRSPARQVEARATLTVRLATSETRDQHLRASDRVTVGIQHEQLRRLARPQTDREPGHGSSGDVVYDVLLIANAFRRPPVGAVLEAFPIRPRTSATKIGGTHAYDT